MYSTNGIRIVQDAPEDATVTVNSNTVTIRSTGTAISVTNVADPVIKRNTITNGTIGINLTNAADFLVGKNTIANATTAIKVSDSYSVVNTTHGVICNTVTGATTGVHNSNTNDQTGMFNLNSGGQGSSNDIRATTHYSITFITCPSGLWGTLSLEYNYIGGSTSPAINNPCPVNVVTYPTYATNSWNLNQATYQANCTNL